MYKCEAIWQYPEDESVYGKINLKEIQYNVTEISDLKKFLVHILF